MSAFATSHRTHTCGEIRATQAGQHVRLCGFVQRALDGTGTLVLRDAHGETTVLLTPEAAAALRDRCPPESVVEVEGTVAARAVPDAAAPTGDVRVEADRARVLSTAAREAPFAVGLDDAVEPEDRLRYRHVYLRRRRPQAALALRSRLLFALRDLLHGRGFNEVETPVFGRPHPTELPAAAGAGFVALAAPGQVYALPGKASIANDLLVAGGLDRFFEVARRFERLPAKAPADRQPEFSALDITLAFADEGDAIAIAEEVLGAAFKQAGQSLKLPLPRLAHEEAIARHGAAMPDLRLEAEIQDATGRARESPDEPLKERLGGGEDGALRVLVASWRLKKLGDEDLAELERVAKEASPAAPVALGFATLGLGGKPTAEGGAGALHPALVEEIAKALGTSPGDTLLALSGPDAAAVGHAAGAVRLRLARLRDAGRGKRALAWVTGIPYWERDFATGAARVAAAVDPLARPAALDEAKLESEPKKARSRAFALVANGVRLASGSVQCHDTVLARRVLLAQGLDADAIDLRYGRLLRAFAHGMPPYVRLSLGIDRLVALLLGEDDIAAVQAFPKSPAGEDLLFGGPDPMDPDVLRAQLGA